MSTKRGRRAHMRFPGRRIIDPARAWYVASTWGVGSPYDEARADFLADKALREADLDVWMPTYEATIVRRGRRIDSLQHFFPGYLFVGLRCGSQNEADEDMQALKRSKHVSGVLGVDTPLRIPHELMQVIADAFSGDVKSERLQAAALYRVGEMMHVVDGPFASFYAMVTELLQSGHVRAEVGIFGRATPVVFEPGQLSRA